jgi:hypothetical protein
MKETFNIIIVVVVAVAGALSVGLTLKKMQCEARWADTGRTAEWGYLSQCRVESGGKMVPEDRIWYERNQ